ncbi:MAG: transcription factor S [Sulfolobales archaeon]|nr:transcription factor S [Sulfolobales archaeon]
MKFCPKCGSLMLPKREDGKTVLACPKCGYSLRAESEYRHSQVVARRKERERLVVIDETSKKVGLPIAKGVKCPRCGNEEAYYEILQTRRADEPPTRIYKCSKCGYVWREYE